MTDKFSSSDLVDCGLDALIDRIRACRICVEAPGKLPPLPHEPRPILRVSSTARLLVASQAPGIRVHLTGLPFNDASGDRLRQWMNVSRDVFYDELRVAIAPMGFCFPGHTADKSDLPPRSECRAAWHDELFDALPRIECILAIGRFAQDYHFERLKHPLPKGLRLGEIVSRWREFAGSRPKIIALPHPSWRNSGWIKRNPWFEAEVVPMLRDEVARLVG